MGNLLVYEQVEILKELIPSVLSSAILLSQLTFTNDMTMINQVLKATADSNVDIAKFIVNTRIATHGGAQCVVPAPLPVAVKLMQPSTPPTTQSADPRKSTPPSVTPAGPPSYWNMQRIFEILFYGYVLKSIYNIIRQSI